MEITMIFVFTLYYEIPMNEALSVKDYGVCEDIDENSSYWLFCCPGYIQNKDTCDDCPFGTTGYGCKSKCLPNYYGLRCLAQCNCTENKRCDSEIGCIESTNSEVKDSTETAGKYWLIIGVPCGIMVIAGAVIASILIRKLKNRTMGNAEIPLNELRNTSAAVGDGCIYDEIDETMIDAEQVPQPADNQRNVQNLERTDSNSSGSTCTGGASDGYLNPYTPLAEDWQKHTHVYNDSDELDEDIETREYLNPYQPLTNEWQKYTHVYDHGSNASSDQHKQID